MKRWAWFLAAAASFGCAGSPASPGESRSGAPPASTGPALPVAEDTAARTSRLIQIEQACDQWYAAQREQEYARMDSLAALLRDYTNQHFEAIVSDLRFGSPRHQKMMAAALGFSGRAEAVQPLYEALEHPQHEVVLHALLSLYHLAAPPAPETRGTPVRIDPERIVPYLAHPHEGIRSNAALVLVRVVDPATPKSVLLALIGTASDPDAATRVHAVAALGATRDREALPHLVKALSDPVQLVRIRAAIGLGRIGEASAAPYLVEVLERESEARDVKLAAARALGQILAVPGEPSLDAAAWRARLAAPR
jgi:hypothetical protein